LLWRCRARFNRSNPYVLNRNLTIRSSAPPELGQMDFQFLLRKVLIAPQITLRLERLVLRNVNKLGGFGLDFFMVRVRCRGQRLHCLYRQQGGCGLAQHVARLAAPLDMPARKCASCDGPVAAALGSLLTWLTRIAA
jgi:hypothetical protein